MKIQKEMACKKERGKEKGMKKKKMKENLINIKK